MGHRLKLSADRTFFTSDTHFNHANIIRFCNRPFSSVEEMDEAMISNWNAVVGRTDLVIHCGDFAFGSQSRIQEIAGRLNGEIILVLGNHDNQRALSKLSRFHSVHDDLEVVIDGALVVLHHYAKRTWNKMGYGSYHFFGHSHGNLPPLGRSIDVGVDVWGFRPVKFHEIKSRLEELAVEEGAGLKNADSAQREGV